MLTAEPRGERLVEAKLAKGFSDGVSLDLPKS
jgi:hypothetical protein